MQKAQTDIEAVLAAVLADGSLDAADRRRLAEALRPMRGFGELSEVLPAKARYLGPGAWLEAIAAAACE
jgi:uncharacterized membrane protein YebE (DUF533 family)